MREQTFTNHIIRKAFQKTGLVPFDPWLVIVPLQEAIAARKVTPELQIQEKSVIEETPRKPEGIIKLAKIMQVLVDSDVLSQDITSGLNKLIKASTTISHTTQLLQRDLNAALSVGDRKRKRQSLRSTVASKTGMMTVEAIRDSAAQREENDLRTAEKAVYKAQDAVDTKHKKRRLRSEMATESDQTPELGSLVWIDETVRMQK